MNCLCTFVFNSQFQVDCVKVVLTVNVNCIIGNGNGTVCPLELLFTCVDMYNTYTRMWFPLKVLFYTRHWAILHVDCSMCRPHERLCHFHYHQFLKLCNTQSCLISKQFPTYFLTLVTSIRSRITNIPVFACTLILFHTCIH